MLPQEEAEKEDRKNSLRNQLTGEKRKPGSGVKEVKRRAQIEIGEKEGDGGRSQWRRIDDTVGTQI